MRTLMQKIIVSIYRFMYHHSLMKTKRIVLVLKKLPEFIPHKYIQNTTARTV